MAPITSRVLAYAAWWKASGWRLRLSEAMLVNPMMGYGGTLDLLAYDRDGRTVLADIKTGKGVYQEAVPSSRPTAWPSSSTGQRQRDGPRRSTPCRRSTVT